MIKKNTVQKFISFESNGKDFANLNKYISQGWQISETVPHPKKKNVFFCLLNKDTESQEDNSGDLTVKEIISLVNNNKIKNNRDNAKSLENLVNLENKNIRILEDA